MYSISHKKVKVPYALVRLRYLRGTLEVRLKYARDSLEIRREVRYATVRLRCGAVRCGAVLYVTVYVQRDRTASRLILRQIAQISAKFRFSV